MGSNRLENYRRLTAFIEEYSSRLEEELKSDWMPAQARRVTTTLLAEVRRPFKLGYLREVQQDD